MENISLDFFISIIFIIFVILYKTILVMNKYNDKGEKHGPWEQYYPKGNLWYKENYINGKKHGLYEIYYYNGNLDYKVNYVNGKGHGLHERYSSNGKLNIKQYWL